MHPSTPMPPLSPQAFYVLLCLLRGESHAYGIKNHIKKDSLGSIKIADGTLYPLLGRLFDEGFIELAGSRPVGASSKGRMHYAITEMGKIRLQEEIARLKHAIKIAEAAGRFDQAVPTDIQRLLANFEVGADRS